MRNKLIDPSASSKRIVFVLTVLMTLIALSGCSSGGGTTTPPATGTITGNLQDSTGAPLSDYTVTFDHATTLVATSNAQGQVTLIVPVTAVTGSDTVTIKDTTGAIVDVLSVTLSGSQTSSTSIGTVSLNSPPGPPSL